MGAHGMAIAAEPNVGRGAPAWPPTPAAPLRRVRAAFLAERDRWALWTPALLGLGVGVYFALPVEPPRAAGALALAAAVVLVLLARRTAALPAAVAAAAVALGFAAVQLRAAQVAAPTLDRQIGPTQLEGRVERSSSLPEGRRLTLDRLQIRGVEPERTPHRVRVTLRGAAEPVPVGAWVRLPAVLNPPPQPAMPGAFDFARQAWFDRLGAVGYAVGRPQEIAAPADAGAAGWRVRVEALRQRLTDRIQTALPGPVGAVAAALMTGDRGAIPEDLTEAMRDSGLAHLLSISGLHIGLVWTLLFFAARAGLALAEPLALRRPIKKWAAAAALAGAFAYLLISGAEVPTQRAFLMTALVTLAILCDRSALSMRMVAWAAGAILLLTPEALLSASFQLSFAAVVALIAAYEALGPKLAGWRSNSGTGRRLALYLGGVALTTLVAGLATGPFGLYHFNRMVNYSLSANLVAVPLTSLWVMPFALLSFASMPFGLEAAPLAAMGWGVELVNAIAREVAGWPGAVAVAPAFPPATLALAALGGLWLCLWRGRWRWAGALALAGGFALGPVAPPDVLIDAEGKTFAVRRDDGALVVSARGRIGFDVETWLRRAGKTEPVRHDPAMRCDRLGCLAQVRGRTVAFVRDRQAMAEDCAAADILLTALWTPRRCAAELVVGGDRLAAAGGHAIWLDAAGARIESVAAARGERPWTRAAAPPQ